MRGFIDRTGLLALRFARAWRLYRLLGYTWRLAWDKAVWKCGCLK